MLPKVIIDNSGSFKFILVKDIENNHYIRGLNGFFRHRQIFYHFFNSADSFQFTCIGGGRVMIDKEKKRLIAYDISTDYGKFDKDITRKLLEEYINTNLDGYELIIE